MNACRPWGGATAAVAAARQVAASCGTVSVVGTLELPCGGGRSVSDIPDSDGIPVLRLQQGTITQISTARTAEDAARAMASEIGAAPGPLRVGIGTDDSSVAVADELHRLLRAAPSDIELLRYRVGPSVGVHTGPGTAGAVYHRR